MQKYALKNMQIYANKYVNMCKNYVMESISSIVGDFLKL